MSEVSMDEWMDAYSYQYWWLDEYGCMEEYEYMDEWRMHEWMSIDENGWVGIIDRNYIWMGE